MKNGPYVRIPAVMNPVIGGSSMASQDSLRVNFGMGEARKGTLEIQWPGGARNRLYNVNQGDHVNFPEIPVSYTENSLSRLEYKQAVDDAIAALVEKGVITNDEKVRFLVSALRAYRQAVMGQPL